MKIGIDLDHCVYGFPEFFAEFIPAMSDRGHEFYCTSNHLRSEWPLDVKRLRAFNIDADLINPELMATENEQVMDGPGNKARMSHFVDINFDDAADLFQDKTNTPVFKTPVEKSRERRLAAVANKIPLL